jgi:Fur family ferric uptake transcriptional regulator
MTDKKLRRNTRQRHVVLDELRKLTAHPTAGELHQIARRRLPRLSLATVYRNLELLARMGVIRKLEIAGREARFDGDLDRHYHVRCILCGRIDDMHGVSSAVMDRVSASSNGYRVLGHHLEFVGICPTCAAAARGEAPGGPGRPGDERRVGRPGADGEVGGSSAVSRTRGATRAHRRGNQHNGGSSDDQARRSGDV